MLVIKCKDKFTPPNTQRVGALFKCIEDGMLVVFFFIYFLAFLRPISEYSRVLSKTGRPIKPPQLV